eukprot:1160332-Pelagomonas_calceolata.AAC.3
METGGVCCLQICLATERNRQLCGEACVRRNLELATRVSEHMGWRSACCLLASIPPKKTEWGCSQPEKTLVRLAEKAGRKFSQLDGLVACTFI